MTTTLEININVLQQYAAAYKLPFASAQDKLKVQSRYMNFQSLNN